MAYNIKFYKIAALPESPDMNSFYYVDGKDFYLGNIKLSNASEIAAAVERIAKNEQDIIAINNTLTKIEGDESVEGSIKKAVADAKAELNGKIGNLENLSTTNKGDLVSAVNEVLAAVGTGGTAAVVTMTENAESGDYAKVYTIKQGETLVGNINIPKDMVVESGSVEVNPEGQEEGTYIVLTLANATSDKLYINVGHLVDIYKAKAEAAQVQIAIDSETREISATIVAGSITSTELAANAVITEKIADNNVTKAKLSTEVQASLDLADSALQKADITTGSANGTIAVEGEDVAVKGLDSAAYAKVEDFDAAGSAATAEQNAKTYADGLNTAMDTRVKAVEEALGEGEGSVADQIATAKQEAIDAAATDATGKANAAEANAKAYTDEALTWITVE